jgi:hypothetical protein
MSTIKITNLTSSGDIVGNVVLPVVGNVAGTLTTLKATVDQLKTFITASAEANILAANAVTIFANTIMKGYVDGQITAANAGVTAANLGMKGYVDSVANQSIYGNANVASYLTVESYAKISDVTTANTIMKGYVDGQITAANAGVTAANIGMLGYIDSSIVVANIGMLGYVDSRIVVANAGVTSANLGMKGYVDNQTYSNVQALAFTITGLPLYEGNIGVNVNVTNGTVTANSFVGNGSQLTGIAYTMGNVAHWTSNVTTISAALDQLAERIYNIENP